MATIPIYNPTTPFLGQIPGGFRPSLMVRVKGKIHGRGRYDSEFGEFRYIRLMSHEFPDAILIL